MKNAVPKLDTDLSKNKWGRTVERMVLQSARTRSQQASQA